MSKVPLYLLCGACTCQQRTPRIVSSCKAAGIPVPLGLAQDTIFPVSKKASCWLPLPSLDLPVLSRQIWRTISCRCLRLHLCSPVLLGCSAFLGPRSSHARLEAGLGPVPLSEWDSPKGASVGCFSSGKYSQKLPLSAAERNVGVAHWPICTLTFILLITCAVLPPLS